MHVRVPDGSGEPVAASWTEGDVTTLLGHLEVLEREHPAVVAVDGRSGAGKSTLARRLVTAVPGAVLVPTDDVAWHFSMFDWTAELVSNVIVPVRRGQPVRYRPPGWITKNRPGAVTVEAPRSLLIVEGVGSSQRGLTDVIDAAIWVQSDADAARQLGIERDIANGVNGDRDAVIAFWDEWAAAEERFLEYEAPWSRANVFCCRCTTSRRSQAPLVVPSTSRPESVITRRSVNDAGRTAEMACQSRLAFG